MKIGFIGVGTMGRHMAVLTVERPPLGLLPPRPASLRVAWL